MVLLALFGWAVVCTFSTLPVFSHTLRPGSCSRAGVGACPAPATSLRYRAIPTEAVRESLSRGGEMAKNAPRVSRFPEHGGDSTPAMQAPLQPERPVSVQYHETNDTRDGRQNGNGSTA